MKKISQLLDTFLLYTIALTGSPISGLPHETTRTESRPARWRLRLAHP